MSADIERAVYAARGSAEALRKLEEKLRLLLELTQAFREEARQSDWTKENLVKGGLS